MTPLLFCGHDFMVFFHGGGRRLILLLGYQICFCIYTQVLPTL